MYIDAWSEYVGHEFGSSVYSKFLKHVGFLANTLPVAIRILMIVSLVDLATIHVVLGQAMHSENDLSFIIKPKYRKRTVSK
jgi:hypothetical protein